MRVGVDYYPEHWDPSMWEADARLMEQTGVSVVRLAEFSWCRLEPEEGRYEFDWLDQAVVTLGAHVIKAVLGTRLPRLIGWSKNARMSCR